MDDITFKLLLKFAAANGENGVHGLCPRITPAEEQVAAVLMATPLCTDLPVPKVVLVFYKPRASLQAG